MLHSHIIPAISDVFFYLIPLFGRSERLPGLESWSWRKFNPLLMRVVRVSFVLSNHGIHLHASNSAR